MYTNRDVETAPTLPKLVDVVREGYEQGATGGSFGSVTSAAKPQRAGNENWVHVATLQALEGHEGSSSEDEDMAHHESQGPTYVQEQQQLRQAFLQVRCQPVASI